jgi:hypothetical protein
LNDMSVAHWVFFPLYAALKVCTTCRPISLSVGTIIFAFLIVIVAIVIAIAGDLKRMQPSLGRRDYLTLLSAQERLHLAELRQ